MAKHSTTNAGPANYAQSHGPAVPPSDRVATLGLISLELIDNDAANERPEVAYLPELLGDLMESLRTAGLQERIKVYAAGDRFLLASGHRRVAAARALGWTTIPAIVEPPPADASSQDIARLASNLCRADIDPISYARGIKRMLADYPALTQAKLGEMLGGRSQSAIANALRLLTLPDDVLTLIAAGKLTAGHGMELLRIDSEERGWDGTPTGKTAADLITEKAQRAARDQWGVATLRSDITSWRANQDYGRKHAQESAERQAAYEAETAALVAAGQDPAAVRQAAAEEQNAARNAEYAAKQARQAAIRSCAKGVIAAAVAADPLGALIVGAAHGLSRLSHASNDLEIWSAFTDPADVVAALQADAARALTLNYDDTALSIYSAADTFANARWGLNRKIADALRAADLITAKEHIALCSPKRQPGQAATPAPAVDATPEPPALSHQPGPVGPPCPGCQTLLTIAGAIYHCDGTTGGCGCFWAADLSPVPLGDGYAALEAASAPEAAA